MMHVVSRNDEIANELYASLPAEVRQQLQQHEHAKVAPRGDRLIQQGVLPDQLIILDSGLAEITVPAGGKDLSLGTAGRGKVFGMRALISGEVPEINVTCLEDCRITLVPVQEFLAVLRRNPQTYFAVAKVLSADLKIADQLIRRFSRRSSSVARRGICPKPV